MDNIVKRYNDYLKERLESSKSSLIEAFVMFYGEKYRDYIKSSIENISFCWGIHPSLAISLININVGNLNNKLSNYLKEIKYLYDINDNRVLGSNRSDYLLLKKYINAVLEQSSSTIAANFNMLVNNNYLKIIYFSMFMCDDKDIIHEINHYLCNHYLAVLETDNKEIPIVKSGISSTGNEKNFFEELINERSSIDITNNFHSINGNIFDGIPPVLLATNIYEKFLPLIESFYNKFLDVIKEAKISENGNILYSDVDKDLYLKYIDYINQIINEVGITSEKKVSDRNIEICNLAVEKMDKNNKKLV